MARDLSIPLWPDSFRPQQMSATIDRPLLKGPKPLDGREQVVASSAGGWMISYDGVPVYGALYQAWRGLWVTIAAQGKPVYVSPSLIDNGTAPALTVFSDSTTFSDGTSFAQSTSDCSLASAASQGATTISVTNSSARPRVVGDWFELNGRAHVIQAISGSSWTIWPPLRANYASGTVLEIDDPRVLAYLTPDGRGNVMNTDARKLTLVSLQFIEAGW